MKKHTPDDTGFAATFEVPANVSEVVQEIEDRAKRTYPDHGESRAEMVKQELIKALSKERVSALAGNAAAHDIASLVSRLHRKLLELETPTKPSWWSRPFRSF